MARQRERRQQPAQAGRRACRDARHKGLTVGMVGEVPRRRSRQRIPRPSPPAVAAADGNEVGGVSPGAAGDRTEPAAVVPGQLADLLERPLYAHLATVRPDGTPQVNPTWVRFDGEYLWLTATTSRRKHRNWQSPACRRAVDHRSGPALALPGDPRPGRAHSSRSGGGRVRPPGRALRDAAGAPGGCRGAHCRRYPAAAHDHPVTASGSWPPSGRRSDGAVGRGAGQGGGSR